MTLSISDFLLVVGAALLVGALWSLGWQAGLSGVGVVCIAASFVVRGLEAAKRRKRR